MRKLRLPLAVQVLFFLWPVISLPVYAEKKETRNIIVIGWDAADRSHVNALLEKGKLPAMAALIKEGKFLEIDIISGATDTKAGWTQLLTGYVPEKTGVFNNGRYEPIPDGYSVFDRLKTHFGAEHIDTVAIIAKKGHVDHDPPYRATYEEWSELVKKRLTKIREQYPWARMNPESALEREGGRIVEKDGQRMVEIPGKPWYRASKNMDLWVNGLEENEKIVEKALAELERRKDRRFFFFIHFAQPDHLGHQYGENSKEFDQGIIQDDQSSGLIIQKLRELGLYHKTLVYIVSDHGFDRGKKTHFYAPYVFTATNDSTPVRSVGTREDLAPTILKKFGVDWSGIDPKIDGYPYDVQAPVRKAIPILTEEFRHRYNYIDNKAINARKVIRFD